MTKHYIAAHGAGAREGWNVYETTLGSPDDRIVAKRLTQEDAERIARLFNDEEGTAA